MRCYALNAKFAPIFAHLTLISPLADQFVGLMKTTYCPLFILQFNASSSFRPQNLLKSELNALG